MEICRLRPAHAAEYRALMLRAFAGEPEAFTSTVPEREVLPMEWWQDRVSDRPDASQLVYGAFDGGRLIGVAGLKFGRRERRKHRGWLYGMYVEPDLRGGGIARALIEAVLDHVRSRPGTRVVGLTVTEGNVPAIRLYESCGFRAFGTEPFAIRHGDRFVAKVYMWRSVGPSRGSDQN